jgi:hypothetical protein
VKTGKKNKKKTEIEDINNKDGKGILQSGVQFQKCSWHNFLPLFIGCHFENCLKLWILMTSKIYALHNHFD